MATQNITIVQRLIHSENNAEKTILLLIYTVF